MQIVDLTSFFPSWSTLFLMQETPLFYIILHFSISSFKQNSIKHLFATMRIPFRKFLMQPKLWRFLGFVSSFVGLLCFAVSSSFENLLGERSLLKMYLYIAISCIIFCFMLFAYNWQLPRNLLLNTHLGFLVLMATSLYSYFNQGKPDKLSLISSASFSVASLSLSRQIDLGFEVDLFNFFLGLLIAQLMMFNKWLAFVGAPICYFLMLLRSYLDSKPHTESETISINGHVTVQIDASNEVEEEAQSDSENGFYTILREDTVHFAPDIEDKLKNTVDAGFAEDCCHVFISWRRQILDNKLLTIRLEKLNLNEIENVPLNFLENKIQRWIMASNYLIRTLLPSERNLCNRVFSGFTPYGDFCFTELCKRPVIQLLNFADAIAAGNGSPERLFRILGLFETLRDLLPGFDSVFSNQYSVVLRNRAFDIERRLREAIKGIFMELENLTHQESAKVVLSNGGLHPLTHYIMNYLGVACKSWRTLERVFRGESSSSSSFSVQVSQIMDLLNSSLERISRKYKDSVLCSVFMMNNLRYIVQKSKRSEVGMVLGEKWIQKHVRKVREYLVEYKSRSWSHVVGMLGDTMRPDAEKIMKVFRLEIEGICEAQSKWVMFDEKLSERVRSSLKKTLVSAYEEGEGTYMKQEDIVAAIDKLFKERDELKNCRNIQPSWTLITPAAQDSYEWSKHAQETILNSTSPRNHYWCIHKFKQGCQASKQVQLIQDNPKIYKTRYTGFHTCRFCRIIPEAPEMLTIADNEESSIICPESSTHPLKQE